MPRKNLTERLRRDILRVERLPASMRHVIRRHGLRALQTLLERFPQDLEELEWWYSAEVQWSKRRIRERYDFPMPAVAVLPLGHLPSWRRPDHVRAVAQVLEKHAADLRRLADRLGDVAASAEQLAQDVSSMGVLVFAKL